MTDAADRLLVDGRVYTLTDPGFDPTADETDEPFEALAIRDGEIVAVGRETDLTRLEGIETERVECEGGTVLPGFVDAHTHMETLGRYRVHADLSGTDTRDECLERLGERADAVSSSDGDPDSDDEWILGFGYDESQWTDARYLERDDLDRISDTRPVVAIRVDMHTASLNAVALDRLRDDLPDDDVQTRNGNPTGVVVERATDAVWSAIEPDYDETRDLLTAAMEAATARGVTAVHDMVRESHAPRVYRDLEAAGELPIRVRLNYWSDHLESVLETGLATNSGCEFVRMGAIKTFTDGSIGGRTAKLFEPYHDTDEIEDSAAERGQWVVDPEDLRSLAERVDDAGLQLAIHAIGDEAIEETIATLEAITSPGSDSTSTSSPKRNSSDSDPATASSSGSYLASNPNGSRHRIEHVELATDDHLTRMARAGLVASMQPNFLQWAQEGGLYDRRLGETRRSESNRFRSVLEAGVPLAFGSDCMPLDPLLGVHHAVTAPNDDQRVSVTEALRAYTLGGAYAAFDDHRRGTLEVGKDADLIVLTDAPWAKRDRIDEIDVTTTVVDGEIVYDAR